MRFVYAILTVVIVFVVMLVGCEPQPEVLAMKSERVDVNTKKTTYYRNGMLSSEAISTRDNGIDDVWKFYLEGRVVRIDEDLNFDGIVDKVRTYDPETGELLVTKIDANFDGTFEIIDEYKDLKEISPEQAARKAANENLEPEVEVITVAEPQTSVIYRETPQETTIEEINTQDEMIDIPPASKPARTSTIVIEEDEFPRSNTASSGSYFEPLDINPGTGSVTPARNSKIVPAPVFTHPSDRLEE